MCERCEENADDEENWILVDILHPENRPSWRDPNSPDFDALRVNQFKLYGVDIGKTRWAGIGGDR